MAAYAALASLMNLIDQIHHHPQPPIALDKEQTQALTERMAFLQDFLKAYNSYYSHQEVEQLRIRIANAAYAAEDVIESHIVDQILAKRDQKSSAGLYQSQQRTEENKIVESTSIHDVDKMCSTCLYQGLQKVLEEMDLVKKDVKEIKEKLGIREQLQRIITTRVISSKSPSTPHNIMVGFDDALNEMLHKLTEQRHSPRQIIPIFGMGGIGKTTLAKNLYTNPLVEQHFHVLAWVTISQEYNIKEILLEVLLCQHNWNKESLSQMSEAELGEKLYKNLFGRRYLIVMDDMWSNDVWDKIKFYFPSNNEGSRIVTTTRLSNIASYLSNGCGHEMDFLDLDSSWSLFCKIVFGEEDCPLELEDIGMEIVKNCRGLPLSIVVVGGLLAKSKPTREYWAYTLGNVSSIVNLEESERCLKILHTSYDELPVHLKVCFLYTGIFPEGSRICVSGLINMWVAEGFLNPISGKSLEESGEEYLIDLIDRNLILVDEFGYSEKIKFCYIHDLLRDLCVREAQKEKFVFSTKQRDREGINTKHRIIIDKNISQKEYLHTLRSASAARSMICYFEEDLPFVELRLLRVLRSVSKFLEEKRSLEYIFQQVNLRYVAVKYRDLYPRFSSSVSLLWNLKTLILSNCQFHVNAPREIWKMPLLRHVECSALILPDPPSGRTDEFVLRDLHTLSRIFHLNFGEEVVKRIPNVKKLGLQYTVASDYCLKNLVHLYKLEYLDCILPSLDDLLPNNLIFPHSLKELSLCETRLSWEDINTKIGSLPHLQVLKLSVVSFTNSEWETIEGQFRSLKYLYIGSCKNWKNWTAESTHFPLLEHLVLEGSLHLKEIPCGIGDIPTLKSVQLRDCSYSAIISAKQIAEEQEELGNESLRVKVTIYKSRSEQRDYEGVESLASHNFQVKFYQIHRHPQPPVTLDKEQIESLTEKVAFLQDFLETYNRHYSNQEVKRLRIRIADAAYAAEDVIESRIVDQILAERDQTRSVDHYQNQQKEQKNIIEPTSSDADMICCADLYQGLQKVLEEMDLIKKDVEKIKEKLGTQEQLQRIITTPVPSKSPSTQHSIMVGFDDVLYELLHKLTGQPHSNRQIIPISGMGGIGKTTLAKNLYTNPLIQHHFHVLAWVTISQEYNIKEILLEILLCHNSQACRGSLSQMSEAELGEKLYKSLSGRRYLIVMDDIWSNDVWEKVNFYFPSNNEGSRIIITTRLSNVAFYLNSGCGHEVNFLDQDNSWSLLCKTVFGEEDCPPELEDIGMDIAKNCRGLPLSIVVLGGLLAKSKPTREYWAYILGNVSSIVYLEESERYLNILQMSYEELPVHLKACFLYMGTFPEDKKIYVPELINMWVAEGFLKPVSGKSLEESGEEHLMDLIDRNLILVAERGYSEKIKFCNIHDLLRDLCIIEAQKEKFVFSASQHDREGINTQRRVVIDPNISKMEYLHTLQSASATRSLICYSEEDLPLIELRLLRIFKSTSKSLEGKYRLEDSFQQVNLRYVDVQYTCQSPIFSTSVSLLWNLQTLIISTWGSNVVAPPEIWKMPLLRNVESINLTIPDPPSGDTNEFVLHDLHTLSGIINLKFGYEVVKRIPNVKKLRIWYEVPSDYCLNNLGHLCKLEYLCLFFPIRDDLLQKVIFPHSLKELCLSQTQLSWEDINTKIGPLPHLQALKLSLVSFTTSEWETIQGLFCSLKYLCIAHCRDWEHWSAESSHFPRLEHLVLENSPTLKEIPCDIGNIPTLESFQLTNCAYSTIVSAKQIAEEQEELGNETLRVTVTLNKLHLKRRDYEGLESLASHNFHVKIF